MPVTASSFAGSWRPALGWILVMGAAWNWVGLPIARTVADLNGITLNVESADLTEMIGLLGGLLGLGTLRTVEKLKGVRK